MLVERIWAANPLRNFHYLIACAETGEALIVDPLDAGRCLAAARASGLSITQILNTHEHRDHTDGNAGVVAATRARVSAHAGAAGRIGGVDRGLARGDVIKVGRTVELEVLDTPGHTRSHVCLLAHGETPGAVLRRYAVQCRRRQLPQRRRSWLALRDLREPARAACRMRRACIPGMSTWRAIWRSRWIASREIPKRPRRSRCAKDQDPANARVTTLGEEKRVNAFLRLQNPEIIARLREKFPEIGEKPDARTVFVKLRELRNSW